MKQYLYSIVAFLSSFLVSGQTVTLFDEDTQSPVIGAAVYNEDLSVSVLSDFKGIVQLKDFDDTDLLTIQHLLHDTVQIIKSDLGDEIYLKANTQALEAIVISASKFEQNRREVPQKITSIKASDIAFNNPQTSADLLENSGQGLCTKKSIGWRKSP